MQKILTGAVESTSTALLTLCELGSPPEAVITLPLSMSSRHSDFVDLRPLAREAGIPVYEIENSNSQEGLALLRDLNPDLHLVLGWSQLCGPELLAIPEVGSVGFHPSALPENRGRAVIPWTILQGARATGSTLFWLSEGVDEGAILAQRAFTVDDEETARSLMDKHLTALRNLLAELIDHELRGHFPRVPQDPALATTCLQRTPEDGCIDWSRPAREVWTLIRAAGAPYPGAFTNSRIGVMRVWCAHLDDASGYWALPGQIVAVEHDGIVVQCGDRQHVKITEYSTDRDPGSSQLRVGERLR